MELQFKRALVGTGEYVYILSKNDQHILSAYLGKSIDKKYKITFDIKGSEKEYSVGIRNIYGENTTEDNTLFKRESGIVTCESQETGKIYECIKKGKHFFGGIGITEVRWEDGNVYSFYAVGFGRKGGIYFCCYLGDELVAEIMLHKKYDSETNYTFYLKDGVPLELLTVATIYWDIIHWHNKDNGWYILNTWKREEKDKFDPNFIEKYKDKNIE